MRSSDVWASTQPLTEAKLEDRLLRFDPFTAKVQSARVVKINKKSLTVELDDDASRETVFFETRGRARTPESALKNDPIFVLATMEGAAWISSLVKKRERAMLEEEAQKKEFHERCQKDLKAMVERIRLKNSGIRAQPLDMTGVIARHNAGAKQITTLAGLYNSRTGDSRYVVVRRVVHPASSSSSGHLVSLEASSISTKTPGVSWSVQSDSSHFTPEELRTGALDWATEIVIARQLDYS